MFLFILLASLGVPFGIGFLLRTFIAARSDWGRAGLALAGAGIPCLVLVLTSFQADAITSAASLGLTPLFFILSLVPSGFGVHLASLLVLRHQ